MWTLTKRVFGVLQPQDMARRQLHDTRVALLDAETNLENARSHVALLAERESRLAAFVQNIETEQPKPFRALQAA